MPAEERTAISSFASAGDSDLPLAKPGAVLLLTLALLGSGASDLPAQQGGPLHFSVLAETGEVVVEVGNLLEDPGILDALQSGLPLRISILTQLWRDDFFDDVRGRHEWRATVLFDPLTRRYRVQTGEEGGLIHEVNTLEEARQALQLTLDIPIRPRESGRYYYEADVEMETLSLSDFQELQRWLKGELGPAVTGEDDVGGAMARGFNRVLVRMLGLPARRFQVRSPTFEVGGTDPAEPLPPTLRRPEPSGSPTASFSASAPNGVSSLPPPDPGGPGPRSRARSEPASSHRS